MNLRHRLLALAALSLGIAAQAAELKGVDLGTHLSGPRLTAADLSGKVVIFEYWGVNCPPCVANIPHVSELAAVASPEVLAVIANHCQGPGRTQWRCVKEPHFFTLRA
jgi:thiol-disulfide isomerase/thioredoxin